MSTTVITGEQAMLAFVDYAAEHSLYPGATKDRVKEIILAQIYDTPIVISNRLVTSMPVKDFIEKYFSRIESNMPHYVAQVIQTYFSRDALKPVEMPELSKKLYQPPPHMKELFYKALAIYFLVVLHDKDVEIKDAYAPGLHFYTKQFNAAEPIVGPFTNVSGSFMGTALKLHELKLPESDNFLLAYSSEGLLKALIVYKAGAMVNWELGRSPSEYFS